MIYYPIVDEKEVSKLHKKFKQKMKEYQTDQFDVFIGHMGKESQNSERVFYSEKLNIWWKFQEIENRYWNPFGIGKPESNHNVSIVCELNYPYSNLNLRIAGLFVKSKDEYLLVHSGKIGGGRKGIGKNHFRNNYTNDYVKVDINGTIKNYAAIASIDSTRFAKQVSNFVFEVDRIKNINPFVNFPKKIAGVKTDFNAEYSGIKKIKKATSSELICDHGLVVNKLKKLLTEKSLRVANDINRDLYILKENNNIKIVFEVKTDLELQSVYKAIGQLLLNNVFLNYKVKMVIVIPGGIDDRIKKSLKKLQINTLEYKWLDEEVHFEYLNKILRD
jgi:hypothetical protein